MTTHVTVHVTAHVTAHVDCAGLRLRRVGARTLAPMKSRIIATACFR